MLNQAEVQMLELFLITYETEKVKQSCRLTSMCISLSEKGIFVKKSSSLSGTVRPSHCNKLKFLQEKNQTKSFEKIWLNIKEDPK